MADITVQELKRKMDDGDKFVFVDVREPHEFEEFNLGAKLIPLNTVPLKMEEISDDKDAEIVVHCRSGKRSAMAQKFMQQAGYSNVRNLMGGVLAWRDLYE